MRLDRLLEHAIVPALEILPVWMDTAEARAMVLTIALQESKGRHRRQIGGGARGFHQWEPPGGGPVALDEVLGNPRIAPYAAQVLMALDYDLALTPQEAHVAIEHNDILDAAFARLLLLTVPAALPRRLQASVGWQQYLAAWRPGKPHPETWEGFWNEAWLVVAGAAPGRST